MKIQARLTILLLILTAMPVHASGIMSTSMEVELGKYVSSQVLHENPEWTRQEDVEFVDKIGSTLLKFTEREGIGYEFHIIESDDVNAFAVPGGFIFLTTGLLDFAKRDPAMIAGVMAHEIGHVERKHGRDAMEDALTRQLGFLAAIEIFGVNDDWMVVAGEVALTLAQQGYSREDEYDADRMGILYTYRAGWDPENGLIKFLAELDKKYGEDEDALGEVGGWFSSHPETDRRVMFGREYLDELRETETFTESPLPEAPSMPDEDEVSGQRFTLGEWGEDD